MSKFEQHNKLIKLVESKTIVPGVYRIQNGIKIYNPISIEKYNEMLKNGDCENLAYNTYSMGRGIFTVGDNGEILNFKGVDSKLEDIDNISIGKVNAQVYDISTLLGYSSHPYGITVMSASGQRSEIRVRGASQLQNLINEKQKLDEFKEKDKNGIIKFPTINEIKPFSPEFCELMGLPKGKKITQEYVKELQQKDRKTREETGGRIGNYAYICLKYMQDIGMPIDTKNQTWLEYFSNLLPEKKELIKDIPQLKSAIEKQDNEYELGASFGQTTRILENPFRIMDLAYFVDNKRTNSVEAILKYTSSQNEKEYIELYAETMGKNLAGFMNLGLAYNNWAHRQDFSLSAEMCDDAYDDVSKSIEYSKDITPEDKHYKHIIKDMMMYLNQIYLFASNMKVIEDAYKMTGREVSENYQDVFIDNFIENLENRDEILNQMQKENSMDFKKILQIISGETAIRNFKGYEEFVEQFKGKFNERVSEYFEKNQINNLFDSQEVGKATIMTSTQLKDAVHKQVQRDQKTIQQEKEDKLNEDLEN